MKFKAIYTSMALLLGASLFLNNSTGPVNAGTGDKSGASGGTCMQCHGNNSSGASVQITILDTANVAQTSYTPGQQYDVIVASNTPAPPPNTYGHGYNVRVRNNSNNADVGTLALNPGANTVMRIQSNVLEHIQVNSGRSQRFKWTAPAAGTDTVVFYGATVICNSNGNDQGDIVPTPVRYKLAEAVPSSVRQAVELSQFLVFPTQAESQINLRFAAAEAGQYTAEVVNINGQVLSTQVFAASQGEQTQSVEVNNLATGTYFVRLRNNQNTIGTKVFVKF